MSSTNDMKVSIKLQAKTPSWQSLALESKALNHPPSICVVYKYNPSGSPSLLVFITLSRADLKSAIWTLILRSLRASRPASEQMALMSAPERSSF